MGITEYILISITLLVGGTVLKKSGFIRWIAPSMEGSDGRSSARALTSFWYVGLNTFIAVAVVILAFQISNQSNPTEQAVEALKTLRWLCVIFNATILLIFGIVSAQNITEGIRAFRGDKSEPTIIETKSTTSVTPGSNAVITDKQADE